MFFNGHRVLINKQWNKYKKAFSSPSQKEVEKKIQKSKKAIAKLFALNTNETRKKKLERLRIIKKNEAVIIFDAF